jgi:hypothetical protein
VFVVKRTISLLTGSPLWHRNGARSVVLGGMLDRQTGMVACWVMPDVGNSPRDLPSHSREL